MMTMALKRGPTILPLLRNGSVLGPSTIPKMLQNSWCVPQPSSMNVRSFGTSKKRKKHEANLKLDKSRDNPFKVLDVKRSDAYATVKKRFLQIAMTHHPDRTNREDDAERHKELFMAARKAFEEIVEGKDGLAILKTEAEDYQEEDDLETWFHQETGYDMPFMDRNTMKEVAKMTEEVGGGLDRDGGMWSLARMVANAVNSGGNPNEVLRLESGDIRDRQINGILRRRRNR